MNCPISISRTSQFQILGVLSGIVHFYSNSNRRFSEQTVETLIRRRVLRCLIWVCAVCLCPTKRTLGLYMYGLNDFCRLLNFFSENSFRNTCTIRVSNSLDPDQTRRFVGPDLGPNSLHTIRLSADVTRR